MIKKILIAGVAGVVVMGAAAFFFGNPGEPAHPFITPSDQQLVARGKIIYANNCASCHGANLEGQPDWRKRLPNGRLPAPPHDESGHTWHHPDTLLIDLVKNGLVPGKTAPSGYESDMPAFGQSLSDANIVAVLAYIKSSWPPEVLEAQKRMTLQQDQE